MRLLELKSNGECSLTRDLTDNIPPYAILSHTWGEDHEEITFQDFMQDDGKSKVGYDKIRFCKEQAKRDNLQYFWIDTCCIDKSNSNELSEAINSMFRWYHGATKCYVYLLDVSGYNSYVDDKSNRPSWETAFRKSRWFTRGWTLQELIAPISVEFFSKEGVLLGDRGSLEQHIHEITGIPVKALQGGHLSDFNIIERMLWAEKRETKREEDKAYSLLGIFDVHMPLIYGEGRDSAFRRLREGIDNALKGIQREEFSVAFSLSDVSDIDYFVGREEELVEMHRKLSSDGGHRTVALHGLGGIGKTQLAVAYTKRHKDSYSAIFWLNIKDEDSIKQSFAKVAKQILQEHPLANHLDSVDMKGDKAIDAVKAWLGLPNNSRWLMIYDNYDNPKLPENTDPAAVNIYKFLPESYQGSIIITTRSSQVKIGHPIQVKGLENIRDSLNILSNTSRRDGLIDDPDAATLAKELDGLPLALATAGAYLDQVAISLSEYLYLYKESWAELQESTPGITSYKDRTLYTIWQISFNYIEQHNKLSAKLLRFWAYFDYKDLWFELLQHGNSEDPDWILELTKDKLSFYSAVRVLIDYRLVEVDMSSQDLIESKGYSIHGCVHLWSIHVLNQEWDYKLARLAVEFVGSHVQGQDVDRWWLTQQRLLQHVTRCSYILLNGLVINDDLAWIYGNFGDLYGKLSEAEKMLQRALQGLEKVLGTEHTSTLNTVGNLGSLYQDQGKFSEAEKMYQCALQGFEKALGVEHILTLDAVNNLGTLYAYQGKFSKSEQMYQHALYYKEKALGTEHISTLSTVNNLGSLYEDQGNLNEAEKMYQRALHGYEKALGKEHTSTLTTINNLGSLYVYQGKFSEAEKMFQDALRGREKALGLENASTLSTVNNLGNLYMDQGKFSEAEQMFQRALQGYEKALGAEYVSTLSAVNNLGTLYLKQGKLSEAEKMFQRALQGHEKVLGAEHISTLNTVGNLGNLYKHQGRLNEAEQMYQRTLQGHEKALGAEHILTLRTVYNLGSLYVYQGKLSEAEKMFQRALQGYEKTLGAEHPSTLSAANNLGNLYRDQGKFNEAEQMLQRAL
ncbi:hypothetical protein OIDMADRAFT_150200 [Oidiodendron maius Zn]|uniref:Uncharacterized protein n=1 Tax=Oidiodendron maius (strain Zn) TaxID=913774 RepID=A0A0C3HVA8_OIDMZ|nr:hypothetical protein OIDMADRAFT_150200 [Oidiodendron maius Zn]